MGELISKADPEIFYSRYAPSARAAYTYARLSSSEDIVTVEIVKLTFDKVAAMLSAAQRMGTTDVSHHILPYQPPR